MKPYLSDLRRPILLAVLSVVFGLGCGAPGGLVAPFRDRPDSVDGGNLLGPFDGQVIDGATGDPVSGALVYASWGFGDGYGLQMPAGTHTEIVATDRNGRYQIPKLDPNANTSNPQAEPTQGRKRVTEFVLVIYKRGYAAYRSDSEFPSFIPRRDFAQRQNQVALKRWQSEFSHVRHLRFVGSAPPIVALTNWEVAEANIELSSEGGTGRRIFSDFVAPPQNSSKWVAAQVLSEDEVKQVTSYAGDFETGPLNDEPDNDQYSSQHFRALGHAESYDVALRLWRVSRDEAERRYDQLVASLPNVEEANELADRSLVADEAQIHGVAFLQRKLGVVFLLTCGKSQCKNRNQASQLARLAFEHLTHAETPGATITDGATP